MAAPFCLTQNKHENAMKLLLDDISASNRGDASVFIGLDGAVDLPLPRIECYAEQGDEDPPNSGNFWTLSVVVIRSDADAAIAVHQSRVGYVVDALWRDDLASALSAKVSDYHCLGIRNRRLGAQRKEGRELITEVQFEANTCGVDL